MKQIEAERVALLAAMEQMKKESQKMAEQYKEAVCALATAEKEVRMLKASYCV